MSTTKTQHIRFGHSPDPDDAFMFYAFAYETIPMNGFKVDHVIEDIESLNQRALKSAELEVTAVSCHAYAHLSDKYAVMRSGASIGDKYGPILVARPGKDLKELAGSKVAIPGKLTTAYLALQIYDGESGDKPEGRSSFEAVVMPFDQILQAVKEGQVDFGLIIHEGQITYEQDGLIKVLDLGQWWYEHTNGLPLPLGVDVIRKDLGDETMKSFAALFKASILYALENRKPALEYAIQYGRNLTEELNDQFVGMYVNDYTVDLGEKGMAGFTRLLAEGFEKGILPKKIIPQFV